jgi:LAS superfamily LD-carboxypeptidase LdcB
MYKIGQALEQKISKAFQNLVVPTLGKSAPNTLGNFSQATSKLGLQSFNFGNKVFQFQSDLGQRLMQANRDMMQATGHGLNITSGFRSFQDQQRLVNQLGGGMPKPGVVAAPGSSLHNYGAAVDIGNWQEASPFLRKYGLINPIKGDEVHFRINNGLSESQMIKRFRSQGWYS